MNLIKEIDSRIKSINPGSKNRTGDIYLNVINNEFTLFDGKINIPRISVNELDYSTALPIVESIIEYIPEYFYDHALLKKKMPAADQHYLHFVKVIRGRHIYFIHMFKLDFKFGGETSSITEQGDSDYYPSFNTSRLYYKSRLIPENSLLHHDGDIIGFTPIRIFDSTKVNSDGHFQTFAMFDDFNSKEVSLEISKLFSQDLFGTSQKIYPFLPFDYFTATFSVLNPIPDEIVTCVGLFEPLFIFIYGNYADYHEIIDDDTINKKFSGELSLKDGKIGITTEFNQKLREYFGRYKFFRDDDMIMKGWRKFEIQK